MKDLLIDMKDTSELMMDLAYSAVIYDDKEIAMEVIRLEEKMDTLGYYMMISAMLSARRIDEAEALAGVLQAGAAAENISNAAGDIAKITLLDLGIPVELKPDLRGAEETIASATVSPESPMAGRTLGEIELETETVMWLIAIRRERNWIYDPDHSTLVKAGDVVFARGHDEGVPLFMECATRKRYARTRVEPERVLGDLDRAVQILEENQGDLGYHDLMSDADVVKVSVIGVGMRSHAGVAQRMFKSLADEGINIQVISTSEIKVSVLIAEEFTERAVRALHSVYGLDGD